jgi:hypothetical protein
MLTASFLLMHIYSKFLTSREDRDEKRRKIVEVFRGIFKDFAELTKTAQMEKTADYTGIDF